MPKSMAKRSKAKAVAVQANQTSVVWWVAGSLLAVLGLAEAIRVF